VAVRKRLAERVCLPDVVSRLRGMRVVLGAQQDGAVHVALAVAHDPDASHALQPLRAPDGDVVDVRTIVQVERDEASGHTWPVVEVPAEIHFS
jgi:hypothetical protein